MTPLDIPVAIGRDEARRRALDELAKAKYGGTPEWLQQAGERAVRLLEQIGALLARWQANRQGGGISPGFVIAVVVALVLLALVVWRVGLPRWRRRAVAGESLDLDPTRPAADYRTLAERHARAGDWRSAVRDRFRALVRELEVRTILDVRPARTAWEAAYSAARTLAGNTDDLYDGAEMFNAVVYGGAGADEAAYGEMVRIDAAVTGAADTAELAAEPVAR